MDWLILCWHCVGFLSHRYYESNNNIYGRNTADWIVTTQPIYQAEGEVLMEESLIAVTEKGLAPLKPLTHMEATAIIVRAPGYENEQTQATFEFVDISTLRYKICQHRKRKELVVIQKFTGTNSSLIDLRPWLLAKLY